MRKHKDALSVRALVVVVVLLLLVVVVVVVTVRLMTCLCRYAIMHAINSGARSPGSQTPGDPEPLPRPDGGGQPLAHH